MSDSSPSLKEALASFQEKLSSLDEEVEMIDSESPSRRMEMEAADTSIQYLSNQQNFCSRKSTVERQSLQKLNLDSHTAHLVDTTSLKVQGQSLASDIEMVRDEIAAVKEDIRNIKLDILKLSNRREKLKAKLKSEPNDVVAQKDLEEEQHNRFVQEMLSQIQNLQAEDSSLKEKTDGLQLVAQDDQQKLWSLIRELKTSLDGIRALSAAAEGDTKEEEEDKKDTEDFVKEEMEIPEELFIEDFLTDNKLKADAEHLASLRRRIASLDEEIVLKRVQLKEALMSTDRLLHPLQEESGDVEEAKTEDEGSQKEANDDTDQGLPDYIDSNSNDDVTEDLTKNAANDEVGDKDEEERTDETTEVDTVHTQAQDVGGLKLEEEIKPRSEPVTVARNSWTIIDPELGM